MNERPGFDDARPIRRARRRRRDAQAGHVFLSMLADLHTTERRLKDSRPVRIPRRKPMTQPVAPDVPAEPRPDDQPLAQDAAAEQIVAAEAESVALSDPLQATANWFAYVGSAAKALNACIASQDAGRIDSSALAPIIDSARAFRTIAEHWASDPARAMEAQSKLAAGFLDLWTDSLRGGAAEAADVSVSERGSDMLRRAHAVSTAWAEDMIARADSVDPSSRRKAAFYARQIAGATAPANFPWSNPDLLRETVSESGGNLARGMARLAEDLQAGGGRLRLRHSPPPGDRLGVDMAASPGKVVFRNELIELIQYSPSTASVFRRPLLIVPPWINKFYILDLNPQRSFVSWAVAQGVTVFMISWVNPDASHARLGFEEYLRGGVLAALDAVTQATGERNVAALGYCVGGTLLSVALAYLATLGDRRVDSATLVTTQVDFRQAGDLGLFLDAPALRALAEKIEPVGYLDGGEMAAAFNLLRPDELVWPCFTRAYLEGREPAAFDLLSWNADPTRIGAANLLFYLRHFYLENRFAEGRLTIGGRRLDLRNATTPVYCLATEDDHIAPAASVYAGALRFGGPVRFVLSGSGHIAGVVNPPAKAKYGYWTGPSLASGFEAWRAEARETPGSWWPDWLDWLTRQAPARTAARRPEHSPLAPICDAPGDYVRVAC